MADLKFRLAPVLRFRERLKEQKQWEVVAMNQARQRMQDEVDHLEEELLNTGRALSSDAGQIHTVFELRLQADYGRLVARRIEERRSSLDQLDKTLAVKREELGEALRDVKTLEQLRTRLEEKFRQQQKREEQKTTDEIGQRKFATRT